jgi:hypothetical protein
MTVLYRLPLRIAASSMEMTLGAGRGRRSCDSSRASKRDSTTSSIRSPKRGHSDNLESFEIERGIDSLCGLRVGFRTPYPRSIAESTFFGVREFTVGIHNAPPSLIGTGAHQPPLGSRQANSGIVTFAADCYSRARDLARR